MYFYPMYIDDELIDTIADSRKILPYIDMPLQHVNDHDAAADGPPRDAARDGRTARQAAVADSRA